MCHAYISAWEEQESRGRPRRFYIECHHKLPEELAVSLTLFSSCPLLAGAKADEPPTLPPLSLSNTRAHLLSLTRLLFPIPLFCVWYFSYSVLSSCFFIFSNSFLLKKWIDSRSLPELRLLPLHFFFPLTFFFGFFWQFFLSHGKTCWLWFNTNVMLQELSASVFFPPCLQHRPLG